MNNNEGHSPVPWANRLLCRADEVRRDCPPEFTVALRKAVRGLRAQMPTRKTISTKHAEVLRDACTRLANVLSDISQNMQSVAAS